MINEKIAVIGLGYVGLPVAVALGAKFKGIIAFDISKQKVSSLKNALDPAGEIESEKLREVSLNYSAEESDLVGTTFFIVAVPTPVDENHSPDLGALKSASQIVGRAIKKGAIVVFESTVYPGVTEEICGPIIAQTSGLIQGQDFKLGYSPERINPGDKEHTLEKIVKVVAAQDPESLERVSAVYQSVVTAGVYRAQSIKVAEAAKVIENTQRDLNIALMNELAIIFDRLNIRTKDVLDAAATKWNFIRYNPGLVGGHCIGVDPYYLTTKAEQLGYHPQVILAGRRINDDMGRYIAQQLIKILSVSGAVIRSAKVAILGLTFKEDVTDTRNSRVPDIAVELEQYGIKPLVHDPMASAEQAKEEYNLELVDWEKIENIDACILAAPHKFYLSQPLDLIIRKMKKQAVFIDVKSVYSASDFPSGIKYWSL
jgi:UDP-N-acetyl-D-galactosamine dehydrogenase